MNASQIFTAAHLAAKIADAALAYRARFTTALRAAWAAAKQPAQALPTTIHLVAINKQQQRFAVQIVAGEQAATTVSLLGQPVELKFLAGKAYVSVDQATVKSLFGAAVSSAGVLIALDRDPSEEIRKARHAPAPGKALFGAAYARHFEMGFMGCSAAEAR